MAVSEDPRTKFGLSCPSGGDFYICADAPTLFMGCCGVDPCGGALGGECPRDQLFDASFSASSGDDILVQGCGADAPGFVDSKGVNRGGHGIWYTYSDIHPPFLGCCSNNPCIADSCLDGNLVPAVLSGDSRNATQFELPKMTASTSSALPTAATSSPSATASGAGEGGDSTKLQIGPIVGIALAGVVILLLVVWLYLWMRRREQNYTTLKRECQRVQ